MDAMDFNEHISPLLPPEELTAMNEDMNTTCARTMCAYRAGIGKDNKDVWRHLIADIILYLTGALSTTSLKDKIIEMTFGQAEKLVESLNDDELKELENGVRTGLDHGNWAELAAYPELWKPRLCGFAILRSELTRERLEAAFKTPYIGNAADDFILHLVAAENEDKTNKKPPYAKAIAVVQSAGTGKSRMLQEVGRKIFTLPVCLRSPNSPGYPPPDEDVVSYFDTVKNYDDLTITKHVSLVCFIAAAHRQMHEHLWRMYQGQGRKSPDGLQLLSDWHRIMESPEERRNRKRFFERVIREANLLKSHHLERLEKSGKYRPGHSANRDSSGDTAYERATMACELYNDIARTVTIALMTFLSTFKLSSELCVMYFDAVHDLDQSFRILLCLLKNQDQSTKMWYVFMGTKSCLSYFTPPTANRRSLRLRKEVERLLPPYFALGFDQRMVTQKREQVAVSMGHLRTVGHLSQYGRPLWGAQLPETTLDEMVQDASLMLTNGVAFDAANKFHVFAVLSQRLCLDPALTSSGALALADHSVTHHMRLLTGFSSNGDICYTHTPSEPILVLASLRLLYNLTREPLLENVLNTLNYNLFDAGLVEKGIFGELCARTLILIARDFAAPSKKDGPRDFLKPVRLLAFINKLFCSNWCAEDDHPKFKRAFAGAYVNFTHWMVTRDPLPVEDLQLLANLWARGAALQCSFNHEHIEFLIPVYFGSIASDQVFNPSCLSVIIGQVKCKAEPATKAELDAICTTSVLRDYQEPLPYLALLMDLGTEVNYQLQETQSRIKSTPAELLVTGEFFKLTQKWTQDRHELEAAQQKKPKVPTAVVGPLEEAKRESRLYNRYLISARSASPDVYGILREACIEDAFETLLGVTMPAPSFQDSKIMHMRPLDRLGDGSPQTQWMLDYCASIT